MLAPAPRTQNPSDDRDHLAAGDCVFLVVHRKDDVTATLLDVAHAAGLKGIATTRGQDAVALARRYRPVAISLDHSLADLHGWAVLSRLKHDPELRHIPVQMFAADADSVAARARGARSSLPGPVSASDARKHLEQLLAYAAEPQRRLLVIEGGSMEAGRMAELLGGANIDMVVAATGGDALPLLSKHAFDCVAMDALLRDMPALELLKRAAGQPLLRNLPFVVYADREWRGKHARQAEELSRTMVIRVVPSLAMLLDDCCMFLHRELRDLPATRQQLLLSPPDHDVLAGKSVLVVDDDLRNIFALSSLLERHDMKVVSANTGSKAIELVGDTDDLSLVVLDVMMPKMDGYETMHRMRAGGFTQPIIALTAKAMTGDRDKCLEAGASDYIAKPVDTENFLSLLRVWLNR
jgi:CheY-like chemotaxis protein